MPSTETKFLAELIAQRRIISVYLKNGIRLQGRLLAHDQGNLYLQDPSGVPNGILKQAVSTVAPNY